LLQPVLELCELYTLRSKLLQCNTPLKLCTCNSSNHVFVTHTFKGCQVELLAVQHCIIDNLTHRPVMPHTPRKTAATSRPSAFPSTVLPSPSPSPKKSRGSRKKNPADPTPVPSVAQLLDQSRQTTDGWYKSERTKKGYANYVKSGKQWLEDWATEDRADDNSEEGNSRGYLTHAFDTISEHTPVALRLLTAFKCEHKNCSFATAEGLQSAFKDYFER
jgi:hypothetical protein